MIKLQNVNNFGYKHFDFTFFANTFQMCIFVETKLKILKSVYIYVNELSIEIYLLANRPNQG